MTEMMKDFLESYLDLLEDIDKNKEYLKDDIYSLKKIEAHLSVLIALKLQEIRGQDEAPEPREDKKQGSLRDSVGGKVQRRKNSG